MKPQQVRRWEKVSKRGVLYFVVVRGCLLWAGLTTLFAAIFMWLSGNWRQFYEFNAARPVRFVAVLITAGCAWGIIVWFWNEWSYRRHQDRGGRRDSDDNGAS